MSVSTNQGSIFLYSRYSVLCNMCDLARVAAPGYVCTDRSVWYKKRHTQHPTDATYTPRRVLLGTLIFK